jgi:hypothetical protein
MMERKVRLSVGDFGPKSTWTVISGLMIASVCCLLPETTKNIVRVSSRRQRVSSGVSGTVRVVAE